MKTKEKFKVVDLVRSQTHSSFNPNSRLINKKDVLEGQIEMLDSLFRHATEGIIVADEKGTMAMVNPNALSLFGYEKEKDLVGKSIDILIPRRLSGRHSQHREGFMDAPLARRMGIGRDLLALRQDGSEFPVEVSLSPFTTSEGRFVVSFIIDITERKRHEMAIVEANEAVSRLNAELEARVEARTQELAQALEELNESKAEVLRALETERKLNELKSQFVTIASHEFRTPLATMLSSVSLIGRYKLTEEDEKRQKHVERVKSAINNLTGILNDFLSIEKMEEGLLRCIPVKFKFDKFCSQLIDELRVVSREGQKIHYAHTGESIVELDNQLMRNVIINVISNGIKYSKKDITVVSKGENGRIFVEIRDRGVGISEEELPHIFDRFFRAQNCGNVQGTGLGLNIVKKYLELMNGNIRVESTLGIGTTFFIEVPNFCANN